MLKSLLSTFTDAQNAPVKLRGKQGELTILNRVLAIFQSDSFRACKLWSNFFKFQSISNLGIISTCNW